MFSEYLELKKCETQERSTWDESIPKEIEVASDLSSDLDTSSPVTIRRTAPVEGKDIFLLEALLSPDECKRIIATTERFGYGRTEFMKHYRGNTRLKCKDPAFADQLFQRLSPFVPSHLTEHHGEDMEFEVVGLNSTFRMSKYAHGDVFKIHVDSSFRKDLGEDKYIEKSMYTLNLYLNDDFQAGHTRFFKSRDDRTEEASIAPKTGLCLLFRQPPHSRYLHDGDMVVGGYKYLLRSDVIYRSTRPSSIFTYVPPPTPPAETITILLNWLLTICQIVIQFLSPTKFPRPKDN